MFKKLLVGLVMVMFMVSGAYGIDESVCPDFGHDWGENIKCVGKYEMSDMGSFVDGVWAWNQSFTFPQDNMSPINDLNLVIPTVNTEVVVEYGRFDNKRYVNGEPNSRLGGLGGYTGGYLIPSIWVMTVEDPSTCSSDWCWYGPEYSSYPVTITHADWEWGPCVEWCDDGCPADDQNCDEFGCTPVEWTAPDGNTICTWDINSPDFSNMVAGPTMMVVGGERLNMENVSHVRLDGVDRTPVYVECDTYRAMSYDTGANALVGDEWNNGCDLYFNHWQGLIPLGDHTAELHMTSGRVIPLDFTVASDRVMPTVAAKTYYTDLVGTGKVGEGKKSKKKIKATEVQVEVDNISAREFDGQLIIQWAEPDGAFQAPICLDDGEWGCEWWQSIRLKIWVGDMVGDNLTFLWTDNPSQSGTVVIPADAWTNIKNEMVLKSRTSVDIGGMYREQFNWFHNRGYIEGIEFTFE